MSGDTQTVGESADGSSGDVSTRKGSLEQQQAQNGVFPPGFELRKQERGQAGDHQRVHDVLGGTMFLARLGTGITQLH